MVLLSFDTEEFDIPEEYGATLSDAEKLDVGRRGTERIADLLDTLGLRATFFVTAFFAEHHPDLVRRLAVRHEIASHGYYHSRFEVEHLRTSRECLEGIVGVGTVKGYRMARLMPVDDAELVKAGYSYNSSMNPTYLPGRYNHLAEPRTAFERGGLLQVPTSVTPFVRFPLFWLSFKNLPPAVYNLLAARTLRSDGYLNLYFHPWEFVDISAYNLPTYVKRHSGIALLERLERFCGYMQQRGATFGTFEAYFKPMM